MREFKDKILSEAEGGRGEASKPKVRTGETSVDTAIPGANQAGHDEEQKRPD